MTLFDSTKSYDDHFAEAIVAFWDTRERQAKKQKLRGDVDRGTRGAVTGAKHFTVMSQLIERLFADAGIPPHSANHILPSYYHATKAHDGVIVHKDELVAI